MTSAAVKRGAPWGGASTAQREEIGDGDGGCSWGLWSVGVSRVVLSACKSIAS